MARERKFSTEELFQATEQLLLQHGYEGFTFSLLAERLKVSRGAIYKYYENKEELILDYMLYEMKKFLNDLKKIAEYTGFMAQFDYLMAIIFKKTELHPLLGMAQEIPVHANQKLKRQKEQLNQHHIDMYNYLQNFIDLGREEGILKEKIPGPVILGFIFQAIMIPNHFGIPKDQWIQSIKEILSKGMFTN